MASLSGTLQRAWTAGRQMDTRLSARLQAVAWPLGLAGLLLALAAQLLFDERDAQAPLADLTPLWLALLAAVLFGLASRHIALEAGENEVAAFHLPSRPRLALLGLGVILCLIAALGFRDNVIDAPELLLWLAGLTTCVLAAWPQGPGTEGQGRSSFVLRLPSSVIRPSSFVLSWTQVALILILALGAFYRLHDLNNLPAEMGMDLYENYADVKSVLTEGRHPIFFIGNQGREPMLYYIAAAVTRFTGLSHYTLKLTTVLIGLATIPLLYLLARELFNREVGLYAAFWLAVSRWHVSLSRSGISFVLLLLATIVVMWLLIRALRRGRALDYVLLGIALGAALYTYKPAPFVIPAAALAALLIALSRRRVRATLDGLVLALALAAAVYAPLGAYAITNREEYGKRIEVQTRILREAYAKQPSPALAFVKLAGHSLAMYNLVGDSNGWFNPPYQRQLGFVSGALLLVGASAVLARLRRGFNLMLLAFFAVMLAPLVLAMTPPKDWGNVSYGFGTAAPVLIVAALPLAAFRRMTLAPGPGWRLGFALEREGRAVWSLNTGLNLRALRNIVTALLFVSLVIIEARDNWLKFFYDYRDGITLHNFALERTMTEEIVRFRDSGSAYVRAWPYWYNGTVIRARLESDYNWKYNPEIEQRIPPDQMVAALPAGRVMVILNPEDKASLAALKAAIPRHIVLEQHDYEGKIAFLMFVGQR